MAYLIHHLSYVPKYRPDVEYVGKPPGWVYPFCATGGPLLAENVPNKAIVRSKRKYLPDFLPVSVSWGVTEEFRAMVEDLEPGVHQFFPIKIVRKTGEPVERKYYILNICQKIDAIIVEKSAVYWEIGTDYKSLHFKRGGADLTLSKQAIDGHHMWRGESTLKGATFFSDALMERIIKHNLKELVYDPTATADDPPTAM